MKNLFLSLCICLTFLYPFTLYADVSGEMVIVHPTKPRELWITHADNNTKIEHIYTHKSESNFHIIDVVCQKDGDYIAFLGRYGDEAAGEYKHNIYLIDRSQPDEPAINITKDRFALIHRRGFDISKFGDVVFSFSDARERQTKGIYLIQHSELQQEKPFTKLLVADGRAPVWFPDGKRIAYYEGNTISFMTVETFKKNNLDGWGSYPIVSPDGRYVAITHSFFGATFEIALYSISTQNLLSTSDLIHNSIFVDFKWSPDGKHIVYTRYFGGKHYKVSFNPSTRKLGKQIEFLEDEFLDDHVLVYDWTYQGTYPVEPVSRLTTMWGKIKQ